MALLRRFVRLDGRDRSLWLRAWVTLWWTRLALWALPFGRVRGLVRRAARRRHSWALGAMEPQRIAWAVSSAGRYVPKASCLTRAMSMRVLLGRRGLPGELRIGIERSPGSRLRAHAWVEVEGEVVIGSHDHLEAFSVMPPLPGES